jgi:hypothetical protein
LHCLEVYGFEHPTVPDVIPPGGILYGQSEEPACIEGTGLADASPYETPMACPTAVHIEATHDHIRGLKKREKAGQVSGVVVSSIIAPSLRDCRITPVAAEHGTTGHGEDHHQRVALAVVTPEIRDLGQDLDQRT